ncbi:MAG TPA: exo-alpha-sialidase [Rhodothermia bacterium]
MINLVVGTIKGAFVFTSDASRREWKLAREIFPGWTVTAIARTRSGRYLAGTGSFVYGATVQSSRDLEHWEQAPQSPAFLEGSDRRLDQIWCFNASGERIYSGVSEAGLFFSDDDGDHWSPVDGLNEHETRSDWVPGFGGLCAHAVLVDRNNPKRLWCGISAVGVFRSDDGGGTWTPKNEGVTPAVPDALHGIGRCVHGLAIDPQNADRIFRQDHMGMYRTFDGADSWEKVETGLPSGFGFPIRRDDRTGTLFVFPQESGEYRMPPGRTFQVYRSRSDGDSWEPAGSGPSSYAGVLRGAMAVDSLAPCGVYVGTTSGTVHISPDAGDSWIILPFTLPRVLCVESFVGSP